MRTPGSTKVLGPVLILLLIAIVAPDQPSAFARPIPVPTSAPVPPPPPHSCPVTLPGRDSPPGAPSPREPSYHGNDELWTVLWPKGEIIFEPGGPGFILPDGSLGMKWPFVPLVPGELAVEGQRLDGAAPPLQAEIGEGFTEQGHFFPTYLIFPTPGCWKVTGRIGEASLTFVTRVVKIGEGPNWRPGTVP